MPDTAVGLGKKRLYIGIVPAFKNLTMGGRKQPSKRMIAKPVLKARIEVSPGNAESTEMGPQSSEGTTGLNWKEKGEGARPRGWGRTFQGKEKCPPGPKGNQNSSWGKCERFPGTGVKGPRGCGLRDERNQFCFSEFLRLLRNNFCFSKLLPRHFTV